MVGEGMVWAARGVTTLRRSAEMEDGQAMVEYGMLVGLLSVVSIFVLTLVGTGLSHVFHTAFAAM